ncbi:MAG TPA: 50S ribosomal protein L11 methyltransferase, partial [Thermomicrobiaceae bacterium]|nr:50S ribosomal protein L11 methyltransferase [Thermomicrobiaceae bacterium]
MADSSGAAPDWLRIAVWADSESVESVSELFGRHGYNQGVVVEEQFRQDDDGDNAEIDPLRPVRVSTYLPLGDETEAELDQLRQGLWHLRQLGTVSELEAEPLRQSDWENSWKEYFQVTRIGHRIVIKPSWREYQPEAGDVVVEIDPGVAFGTGLHPSTRLALLWLEDIALAGKTMADIGAGSGIL